VNVPRIPAVLPVIAIFAALTGCGGGSITSTGGGGGGGGGGATGASFTGKVLAAQQPVSGAAVQLYAAGNSGNGSAPTALLAAAVTSGADGTFTIPGGYTCPSAQTPIYLVSKGGAAGSGSANASLWLMTVLAPCGSVTAGSSFAMNEVTTAASVWPLAPFMSSGGEVGSSSTNATGLNNAILTANNLMNVNTGASPGAQVPTTLTVPTSKLNTLANALASCTRSSGGSSCPGLFTDAAAGSTTPSNTIDAALNLARAPGSNVAAIYALASANAVFTPALSAAPPDLMLHNTVKGGGMASPASVGVAASGNVWVSSYFAVVSEFTPAGATEFPSGITGNGINQSYGLALDMTGDVWLANEQTDPNSGNGDVAELNSAGSALKTNLTAGGISFPIAAAADSNGNMWFADYGDSKVTVLNSSGTEVSASPGWGGSSLAFPVALAVDSSHNAWVANQAGLLPITKISADGSQATNYNCNCNGASGIAIDEGGNVWVANYYGNSISEVTSSGTVELSAITGGGADHPQGIAVDGGGTVWVTNFLGNSLSEIGGASSPTPGTFLSPSTGFGTDASILQPYGLAIDASGNIWVSNFGNDTLSEFIGVATPVKTPMVGPPQQP